MSTHCKQRSRGTSMPGKFHMRIEDVFFLRDGFTVFAGQVEEGERAIIVPGPATVFVDGESLETLRIQGEAIPSRSFVQTLRETRAVHTRDATKLTKAIVEAKNCMLEGDMRYSGHRHLLGMDSPPAHFMPDD